MNNENVETQNIKTEVESEIKMRPFNWHGFKMILQSTQTDLMTYFEKQIPLLYGKENCHMTKDFIYAKGNIPVLMVAHLDTVHTEICDDVYYDPEVGHIWSPQGCGGDDRCGVLANIFCATHFKDKKPHILFTTFEETGCVGAGIAAKDKTLLEWQKELKYIIEFDRKGSDEMVFYGCSNDKFQKYIGSFGFKFATGSCSDISKLCVQSAWNVAGVNLSSGYYNAHTTREYIRIKELFSNIEKVLKMFNDIDNVDRFVYNDGSKKHTDTLKSNYTTTKPSFKTLKDTDYYDCASYDDDMCEKLIALQIANQTGAYVDLNDPMGVY